MAKTITVQRDWLEAVANLVESCATSKEDRDLTGQPPEEILLNVSQCVKKVLQQGGERGGLMNYYYFSFKFLDELLTTPKDLQDLYKKSLSLIVDEHLEPESAFADSGFARAYEAFKQQDGGQKE